MKCRTGTAYLSVLHRAEQKHGYSAIALTDAGDECHLASFRVSVLVKRVKGMVRP